MTKRDVVHGNQINLSELIRIFGDRVTYEDIVANFRLPPLDSYNMAADTVDRQVAEGNGSRVALVVDTRDGGVEQYTYHDLSRLSAGFAAFLRDQGIGESDVIVSYCAQGLEAALAHLAAYKLGAVVAPLSQLYGPEAVAHAVRDCDPVAVITQAHLWPRIAAVCRACTKLKRIIASGGTDDDSRSFEDALKTSPDGFVPAVTDAEAPALLLYTSGSTGMPKGILHRQRILQGYLASVSMFYELQMGEPGQRLWTASDWSWVAGIFNVMLTGWYFGQTVIASDGRFTPDWAFGVLARHGVTHCFLTPTALKRMAAFERPKERWPGIALRAIGTGGEPLPTAVLKWGERTLGVPINEFYGLTEVNHLIGNCRRLWPIKPGSMGRPYPGHVIALIDESGRVLAEDEVGEVAVDEGDPTLFLGYWRQPERTAAMRIGTWIRTGDYAHRDTDGYYWYHGRQDDLIKSAGYRIGPAEVEDALVRHPAVAEAAVVGRPDAERGQIVMAYIRLADGHPPSEDLVRALQDHVKENLAFYKYPREVEFVERFPLTSTGKINRKRLRSMHQDA